MAVQFDYLVVGGVDVGGCRDQSEVFHVGFNGGGGGGGGGSGGDGSHRRRGGAVTARGRGQAGLVNDVALRDGDGHRFGAVVAVVAAVAGHHVFVRDHKQMIPSLINITRVNSLRINQLNNPNEDGIVKSNEERRWEVDERGHLAARLETKYSEEPSWWWKREAI